MKNKQLEFLLISVIVVLSAACLYLINKGEVRTSYTAIPDATEIIKVISTNDNQINDIVFDSGTEESNVVGYFANGAFTTVVPSWMANNWYSKVGEVSDTTVFSPRTADSNRDFTDIVVYTASTSETLNAAYLFDKDNDDAIVSEILIGQNGDFRIYHTESRKDGRIFSKFYIDGNGQTGIFTFDASEKNYYKYSVKIKEFIFGLGVSEEVRG